MTATNNLLPTTGPLDGRSVLRFAHAFESGGGTERYLEDLDNALLQRNAMTIVRLHLTRNPTAARAIEESVGKGKLIRVPLQILPGENPIQSENGHSFRTQLKQRMRDRVLYNQLVWNSVGSKWVAAQRLRSEPGQAIGAGSAAAEALRSWNIDLVMLHFFGGADADEVMVEARKSGIPTALLNHYSNDRFMHMAIRKHAMMASALAGVNGLDLPQHISRGFTNLSDGVDTEFFRRAHARPLTKPPVRPIILLPGRVIKEKGQMDLVRAVASLHAAGCECDIAFAGRVDSSGFVDELRREIAEKKLTERVHFLGALALGELRDWYAASAIAVLPTYHHEGLPRVILEAQAMGLPVVAYATGGVADGILPGETGFLLRTGDGAGLAERLRELLTSPTQRSEMGAAGRAEAEARFSLSALATRHEQFYLRVIKDSENRQRSLTHA